jgi:hypothetical protein
MFVENMWIKRRRPKMFAVVAIMKAAVRNAHTRSAEIEQGFLRRAKIKMVPSDPAVQLVSRPC